MNVVDAMQPRPPSTARPERRHHRTAAQGSFTEMVDLMQPFQVQADKSNKPIEETQVASESCADVDEQDGRKSQQASEHILALTHAAAIGAAGSPKNAVAMNKRILTVFNSFDLNRDGFLSREELTTVFQSLDPLTWTDEALNTLMTVADRNGDGKIDLEEFVDWMYMGSAHHLEDIGATGEKPCELPGSRHQKKSRSSGAPKHQQSAELKDGLARTKSRSSSTPKHRQSVAFKECLSATEGGADEVCDTKTSSHSHSGDCKERSHGKCHGHHHDNHEHRRQRIPSNPGSKDVVQASNIFCDSGDTEDIDQPLKRTPSGKSKDSSKCTSGGIVEIDEPLKRTPSGKSKDCVRTSNKCTLGDTVEIDQTLKRTPSGKSKDCVRRLSRCTSGDIVEIDQLLKRIRHVTPAEMLATSHAVAKLAQEDADHAGKLRLAFGRRVAHIIRCMPLHVLAEAGGLLSSLPENSVEFECGANWQDLVSVRLLDLMERQPVTGKKCELAALLKIFQMASDQHGRGIGKLNLATPALESIVNWVKLVELKDLPDCTAELGQVGIFDQISDALSTRMAAFLGSESLCGADDFKAIALVVNLLQASDCCLLQDACFEDLVCDEVKVCLMSRGPKSWSKDRLCAELQLNSGLSIFCQSSLKVQRCSAAVISLHLAESIVDSFERFADGRCQLSDMDDLATFQHAVEAWKQATQNALDVKLITVDESWRRLIFDAMEKVYNSTVTSPIFRKVVNVLEDAEDHVLKLVPRNRVQIKGTWRKSVNLDSATCTSWQRASVT